MNDELTKRMLKPLYFLVLFILMAISSGCSTTESDLIPQHIVPAPNGRVWEGSVNVQANVSQIIGEQDFGVQVMWADSAKFKTALKTAIFQKGLFSRIGDDNTDYVLDVWVVFQNIYGKQFSPIYEMNSIWRLTRTTDGKVLFCDFAHASAKSGRLITKMITVSRETIQNGMSLLSDRSQPHMSAFPANIWPSMGSVVPEDLRSVRERSLELRKGMTYDEATVLLDPSRIQKNTFINKLKAGIGGYSRSSFKADNNSTKLEWEDKSVTDFLTIRTSAVNFEVTKVYTTGAYELIFVNNKLIKWELFKKWELYR